MSLVSVILLCFFVLILIRIVFVIRNKEYYISHIYTPTYFERNPASLFISNIEKEDVLLGQLIKSYIPVKIVNDVKQMDKCDLCILPEPIVVNMNSSNYRFVVPLHMISYTVIVNIENSTKQINNFHDIEGKNLCIYPKGGYTEDLLLSTINRLDYKNPPNIKSYDTNAEIMKEWNKGNIDAIVTIIHHPNKFIKDLSISARIKIVTWNDDRILTKTAKYYLPGILDTTLNLENYRLFDLNKRAIGNGYKLCLFANKNVPTQAIFDLTKKLVERGNSIRISSVGGSAYIPYHEGTRVYFESKGFISKKYGKENPACMLLAGKKPCIPNTSEEKAATVMYNRDFWLKGAKTYEANDFLKKAKVQLNRTNNLEKKYGKILKTNNKKISEDLKATLDLRWQCFGNTQNRTQKECESTVDIKGDKRTPGVWDKPCIADTDCPFYKKNKNYPNSRGGCNDGFCEMPINVKRLGFTRVDKNTQPLCHGCKSLKDKNCCKKKGNMVTPDYAFLDDRNERIRNKEELELRGLGI